MAEKYNVVIKDNETGEILENINCSAIVGSFTDNEKSSFLFVTYCKISKIINCIKTMQRGIENKLQESPELQMAMLLENALKNKEKENTDNE